MTLIAKLGMAGAALILACTTAAQAQTMRASVPFRFHAGQQVLPAGDYQVQVNQLSRDITITSLDTGRTCFLGYMAPYTPKASGNAKLVFVRYDSGSFLRRLEPGGFYDGVELFTTKAERELAKASPGEVLTVEASN
jgi:hypothetical protein